MDWLEMLVALVAVGVAIMVAAVPWAFVIGGRLSSIDGKLELVAKHEERLDCHQETLSDHETRITILETD